MNRRDFIRKTTVASVAVVSGILPQNELSVSDDWKLNGMKYLKEQMRQPHYMYVPPWAYNAFIEDIHE